MKIKNPILPGFNPDPSILRVGDDYYIATSTFEWFPGVQIHHSRDLVNWRLAARPLNRLSQLNMAGNPNSGGIWAPCLSYHDGTYYLIYTDVKTVEGLFKDAHNFLVTTNDILGDWSEPVYLNSSGFDPSLFHDDDGKKWLLNLLWDHRIHKNSFQGILLQEYSEDQKTLVGSIYNIFKGSDIQNAEGPHLYKRNGYYYLMTAEGGTGLAHAVSMARSKNISGPYEIDPQNPVLTSYDNPELELQRAGHGSLVETQNGEYFLAHLCGRPLPSRGRCVMGRETAIQKMKWTPDGWLRLESGGRHPQVLVNAPGLPEHKWKEERARDDFDSEKLNVHFQSLRVDISDLYSLTERPGFLRLKGAESLSSNFKQALLARRQQAFRYSAETCLDYNPENAQQMAGLICMYDNRNFYYLHVTFDDEHGRYIDIMTCTAGNFDYPIWNKVTLKKEGNVYLNAYIDYDKLRFSYSQDGKTWNTIGHVFDYSTLSDEFCPGGVNAHFTGSFVGLCCQDLSGMKKPADFDYFEYREIKK
jgi:xylan 1,4-beta-xylosidase